MKTPFVMVGIGAALAVAGAGAGALLLLGSAEPEAPRQAAPQQSPVQQTPALQTEVQQTASQAEPPQDQSGRESSQVRRQDFADWALICPGDGASERCLIAQHHLEPESQRPILAVQLRRAGGNGVEADIITPLYVLLKPGLALEIGRAEPIMAQFSHCINQQCQATVSLDDDGVSSLLSAGKAQARFAMATGQSYAVDISFDGLTEALAALGVQSSPANLLRR